MVLNLRHFVHPDHPVAVETGFLRNSFAQRYRPEETGGQAKADAAFQLCGDLIGRYGNAAIDPPPLRRGPSDDLNWFTPSGDRRRCVIHCLQMSYQARTSRFPAKSCPCPVVRRCTVAANEHRQPAEMGFGLFGRQRDQRNIEAGGYRLSDIPESNAWLANCMVGFATRSVLEHRCKYLRDIGDMRRRPAVIAVTDKAGTARSAGVFDVKSNEALLDRIVHLRKPDDPHIHARG